MGLSQLLLPTTGAAAAREMAPLAETRRELAERFTGVTAYVRSPAKGQWTAPDGHTEQDDVVMVEVVTDTFDRGWWRTYSATLAERFHQETIHVRAVPVEMLDEEPKLQSPLANVTPAGVLAEQHRKRAEPGSGHQPND
jgi:hypothetical protein